MIRSKDVFRATLFACGGLLLSPPVVAATSADEELAAVDATIGGMSDQTVVMEMVTNEPGKAERRLTFEATVKGTAWRRVEFLAPADVKGTRVLVLGVDQMYIYLPAYRKVRRIATHVKEQGFMGSAWDHDEIALAVFGKVFRATAVADHGATLTLTLERKADQAFLYPRLEVDVRKDLHQPIEIRYFNDAGVNAKTETRSDFTCQGKLCTPRAVEMVDHSRGELKSRMLLKDWQVNRGVPDSLFTVRALQRGG
ncbi:MAG: outer membrane lipoprotein-sorting protein [Deltaproteobacteria bacterium]|nr:outer membrane lipoprotein-sorting protein [Deltaproteobacteria bacterium]